jgi:hypothetical protein
LEYEALGGHALFERYSLPVDVKSDAASAAVESLNKFDGNLIAFAKDLPSFGGSLQSILDLGRNFSSPKAWANAWLAGRFGDRLTIADSREILSAMWHTLHMAGCETGRGTVRISQGHLTGTYTTTLIASNKSYSGLMTAVKHLMDWDAWPTLENIWDMVPYSFVVDWFISIGDLLKQIDLAVKTPYIRAVSQYASLKLLYDRMVVSEKMGYLSQHSKYYRRSPAPVLSYIQPFRDLDILPSFSVVNYGDAASLLVQNLL